MTDGVAVSRAPTGFLPIVTKYPGERRIFTINLGPRMRPTDVLDPSTVRVTAEGLEDVEIVDLGAAVVSVRCSGGVTGETYLLRFDFGTEPAGTPTSAPLPRQEQELVAVIGVEIQDPEDFI